VPKRILVLFETAWDRPQLEACRASWSDRYEVAFAEPADAETPWDLDIVDYIAREAARWRGVVDGVFSTSDYPGATTAGALAGALGLAGSAPAAILRASHKYQSRLAQREVAPEAVPAFALLDPRDPATWTPSCGFPCFVKPVKGAFSIMAGKVASTEELRAFLTDSRAAWFENVFLCIFDQLVQHFGLDHDGRWFIAEKLLSGRQVTVEGWRTRSDAGILGIVDSTFQPGTKSFVRFDYPSSLSAGVQERMADVVLRVTSHLGLVDTLFNVEMTWDPETDAIGIVEVNPRACGQFADLYQKVDGVHAYEVALAVAAGDPPPVGQRGAGAFAAAASFPLRAFEPVRVRRSPPADAVRRVQSAHPGTIIWIECATGDVLADFGKLEDGESYRYAIVNLGGRDRDDLAARCARVRTDLEIELEPCAPAAGG